METVSGRFEKTVAVGRGSHTIQLKTNNQNISSREVLKGVEQLHQESLVETWKDYQTRFENIDQSVERFPKKLQMASRPTLNKVHNFMGYG